MAGVSNTTLSKQLEDILGRVERGFKEARKDREDIRELADKHERILIGKNGDPGVLEMMRDTAQKVDSILKVMAFIGVSVGGWLIAQLLGLI